MRCLIKEELLTPEDQLELISQMWRLDYDSDNSGYVFFPWIPGDCETKEDRIRGYHEGHAFRWPKDRDKILVHMRAHVNDDLYWCPTIFESPHRRIGQAMDEGGLWADLDEVNPRHIEDEFKPTVAWETSPGRYQALWVSRVSMLGASWPGEENQRLTYYLGADHGGWDTTQLLRIPGWTNHKPAYRRGGKGPRGKLLWSGGRRYSRRQFEDLPAIESISITAGDIIETDVAAVDRAQVWGRVRLKVTRSVRELVNAREPHGDRSATLWPILRGLADAGCTLAEIVAIARHTVWNKFAGRHDELQRLSIEAAKAIEERPDDVSDPLEPKPEHTPRLVDVIRDVRMPEWLVEGIWTEGAVGFIGGQPKSFKSWFALDLALSIAMGSSFLGEFAVPNPGPVLYVQEEDGAWTLKKRFHTMIDGKQSWRVGRGVDGLPEFIPADEANTDPDIGVQIGHGVILSDPGWQEWLSDRLAAGLGGRPYRAMVLDPLMMMQGDVEENRAGAMTDKIFRPLKVLARQYDVAIILVHHMRKMGKESGSIRGGQALLGSVANHAWTEDSLYLSRNHGNVKVEVESKNGPGGWFEVGRLRTKTWLPQVMNRSLGYEEEEGGANDGQLLQATPKPSHNNTPVWTAMRDLPAGRHGTGEIAKAAGVALSTASRQLNKLADEGKLHKVGRGQWALDISM